MIVMPWWGWLIAFCVAAICLTVIAVVAMMTGTIRTMMSQDMDAATRRTERRPL